MDDTLETMKALADALKAARDHLEYVGYGDAWERECAESIGLEDEIKEALSRYENEVTI